MQTKNIFWDNEIFIDCSMEPPIPVANDNYLAVWNKHLSTLTHYPYLGDKLSDGVEVVEGVDYTLQHQYKKFSHHDGGYPGDWRNCTFAVYENMVKVRIVAIGIPKATVQVEKTCVHCFEFISKHKLIGLDCPTAIPGIWKKTQFSTTEPLSEKTEEKGTQERFKMPTDDQIVKAAIVFNDGRINPDELTNMVALADWIIARLYENGDISIPASNEN